MSFGPSFTFDENSYWQSFQGFEDWYTDPDIANAARELYGGIDRLELYPGHHAEGHQGDSFGKQEKKKQYSRFYVSTAYNGLLLFGAIAVVCLLFLQYVYLSN